MAILKLQTLKIYTNINHVKDYQNLHIYVMAVNLDVVVEKKNILIMLEKLMILTGNGHEFFYVNNIECMHETGEYITHLFLNCISKS